MLRPDPFVIEEPQDRELLDVFAWLESRTPEEVIPTSALCILRTVCLCCCIQVNAYRSKVIAEIEHLASMLVKEGHSAKWLSHADAHVKLV